MPAGCITAGPKSVNAGNGQPLACAAVLQPLPISCHFRGCKSAAVQDCKWRYSKRATLPFTLVCIEMDKGIITLSLYLGVQRPPFWFIEPERRFKIGRVPSPERGLE